MADQKPTVFAGLYAYFWNAVTQLFEDKEIRCEEDGTLYARDPEWPQAFGYDAQGRLSTITETRDSGVYVKTNNYDASGRLSGSSAWVKQ